MLGRTADRLYWMARYIERAENVARTLEVTYQMSLLPSAKGNETALWSDALHICADASVYEEKFGEITAANVIRFLTMDEDNLSSIHNAIKYARENARSVRVAMTSETWENINGLWIEFGQYRHNDLTQYGLAEFCEWVWSRSHLFRGVSFGTMLRDEAFSFVRLGGFIERADNTARLLNAKYEEGDEALTHEEVDYYEWSAVLRSVSAFQAYQKVYSNAIEPSKVSELLVLREDMPRSLHACYSEIVNIIEHVSGARQNEARRLSGELHARLRFGKMSAILSDGLEAFLEQFILANNKLGKEIQRNFVIANA